MYFGAVTAELSSGDIAPVTCRADVAALWPGVLLEEIRPTPALWFSVSSSSGWAPASQVRYQGLGTNNMKQSRRLGARQLLGVLGVDPGSCRESAPPHTG